MQIRSCCFWCRHGRHIGRRCISESFALNRLSALCARPPPRQAILSGLIHQKALLLQNHFPSLSRSSWQTYSTAATVLADDDGYEVTTHKDTVIQQSRTPRPEVVKIKAKQRLHLRSSSDGSQLDLVSHISNGTSNRGPLSSRAQKRFRRSPVACLTELSQIKDDSRRQLLWNEMKMRGDAIGNSLPIILAKYTYNLDNFRQSLQQSETDTITQDTADFLRKAGYSKRDLARWSGILKAKGKLAVKLCVKAQQDNALPSFVYMHLVAQPQNDPLVFQALLALCWDTLHSAQLAWQHACEASIAELDESGLDKVRRLSFEMNAFEILVTRFLTIARSIWPPAMTTISHMATMYMREVLYHTAASQNASKKATAHIWSSKFLNKIVARLSLPAQANPFKSMTHNWEAQRVLLAFADEVSPRLNVNRQTYRAVASVLVATSKSLPEKTFAGLMQRSWPPWRRELDGMDITRARDADLSRALHTLHAMGEAGYVKGEFERAIQVLGGRDDDYTPTVPTRSILKPEGKYKGTTSNIQESERLEVAARVRATRDPVEAWAVFCSLPSNETPSRSMYFEMFQKLVYSEEVSEDIGYHVFVLPGEGRESLPRPDDNLSDNERRRRQPPTLNTLYVQMLEQKMRPSGRLLVFLLEKAASFKIAAQYLKDSSLNHEHVAMLLGLKDLDSSLKAVDERLVASYVRLVCRLARESGRNHEEARGSTTLEDSKSTIRDGVDRFPKVAENPLLHALNILQACGSHYKPTWYELFDALAHKDTVLEVHPSNNRLNDVFTWQVLEQALKESRKCGVRLDPKGFQIVCRGYRKAMKAALFMKQHRGELWGSLKYVKLLWSQMTRTVSEEDQGIYIFPALLHQLEGAHIHVYVRCLRLVGDLDGLREVLQWMKENQEALTAESHKAKNGQILLHRTIVAIRVAVEEIVAAENDEAFPADIRSDMEQIEVWGGWPSNEEVDEYLELEGEGSTGEREIDSVDDVESQVPGSVDDAESQIPDSVDDVESQVPDSVNDVESQVPDSVNDAESQGQDFVDDVESHVQDPEEEARPY